ncbi:MAG TPA: condensation domain-containing protein, partial [Longimicrobiaceae bacterium]
MSLPPEQLAGLSPERRILLQRMLRERAGADGDPDRVRPREEGWPAPLSFAQQRLWLIDRLEPGSTAYIIPAPLRLRGRMDTRAMARALTEVARRQESLRTVFAAEGDEPVQVVLPPAPVPLPLADLRGLPHEARDPELRRLVAEETRRPFHLERGPLFRVFLARVEEEEWALLLSMHHAVSDGWSLAVLVRELSALYEAFARGEPSPLPELPVQYADFAVWQRERLSGEALEAQLGWWRERLAGAPPVLDLPTDRPRSAPPGVEAGTHRFLLSEETAAGVRALARAEGATPFMALLAAWQLLLGRYAGSEDVGVGTSVAGRGRKELEGLIGFFVNTLVLRVDLSGDPAVRELLGRVRETALGAFAHQDVPFERLVEELQPERSLLHSPLFQVMFSLNNLEGPGKRLGSLEVGAIQANLEAAKFDLGLGLVDADGRLDGSVTYRRALFDASTAERMAGHFARVLAQMAAAPDARISTLDPLTAGEREEVLGWGRGGPAEPGEETVHGLFAAQAARTPDAVALVSGPETLTYADLDRRADVLAALLRERGAGPEVRVGVCL